MWHSANHVLSSHKWPFLVPTLLQSITTLHSTPMPHHIIVITCHLICSNFVLQHVVSYQKPYLPYPFLLKRTGRNPLQWHHHYINASNPKWLQVPSLKKVPDAKRLLSISLHWRCLLIGLLQHFCSVIQSMPINNLETRVQTCDRWTTTKEWKDNNKCGPS